jgi:hypothetical protein
MFTLNDSKTKLNSDTVHINQGQVDSNNKTGLKSRNLILHGSGGSSLKQIEFCAAERNYTEFC